MSLSFTVPKFILFCVNFLLVIIGLALAAIGAWAAADDQGFINTIHFFSSYNTYELQLYQGTSLLRYFSYGVIIMGSLLVVIAFVGCWGLVTENRRLLLAFSVLMIILVLLEGGAAGAMAGTTKMWMEDQVTMLKKRFQMNYRGTLGAFPVSEFDAYSLNMDRMMISLECCGVISNGDFSDTESLWYKEGRKYTDGSGPDDIKIPPACCKYTSKDFMSKGDYNAFQNNLVDENCVKTLEQSNEVGCFVKANTIMREKGLPYIAIPSIIVALQLATIVLSIYLVSKLKKWDNELYY